MGLVHFDSRSPVTGSIEEAGVGGTTGRHTHQTQETGAGGTIGRHTYITLTVTTRATIPEKTTNKPIMVLHTWTWGVYSIFTIICLHHVSNCHPDGELFNRIIQMYVFVIKLCSLQHAFNDLVSYIHCLFINL